MPCVLLAGLCVAQTANPTSTVSSNKIGVISGIGSHGYLPKFSGPNQINDSNIFQSTTGTIGIGTTAPIVSLHVFSSNPVGPPGYGPNYPLD